MSHFSLEEELSDALRMDGPMRGPAMRWQRKQTSVDNSFNVNASLNASCASSKTPMKNANRSATKNTSGGHKTPKSGGKKTPGKGCKTPSGGDRFIPNRSATQYELAQYMVAQENQRTAGPNDEDMLSPSKLEYQKVMSDNLNGDLQNKKFLSYKAKAPSAPDGYGNSLQVLYSSSCKQPSSMANKKSMRNIPTVPERILDAPEILDDYYLNLLDWSQTNQLAVALGNSVYLWNATSGDITQLLSLDTPEEYVGSVSFVKEGNFLAVGSSSGEVQLWDVTAKKRLRKMVGHSARVGALSWNSFILSSGSRSGNIHHHDVRVPDHHIATLSGHTQEVCGLRWSPDGRYLASGGNDNVLNVWSAHSTQSTTEGTCQPQYQFSQHLAAVKALAWCPWLPNVLASGGGTADRHIRFWNCNSGSCLEAVDTKSQVCALLWSREYKELISSHGFALNQLTIWKYPAMTKVAELTGHSSRVLHMVMSPDQTTVMSAGADETLRLWKCFAVDTDKRKAQKSAALKHKDSSISHLKIR